VQELDNAKDQLLAANEALCGLHNPMRRRRALNVMTARTMAQRGPLEALRSDTAHALLTAEQLKAMWLPTAQEQDQAYQVGRSPTVRTTVTFA
jgi:hypothetical protein